MVSNIKRDALRSYRSFNERLMPLLACRDMTNGKMSKTLIKDT